MIYASAFNAWKKQRQNGERKITDGPSRPTQPKVLINAALPGQVGFSTHFSGNATNRGLARFWQNCTLCFWSTLLFIALRTVGP